MKQRLTIITVGLVVLALFFLVYDDQESKALNEEPVNEITGDPADTSVSSDQTGEKQIGAIDVDSEFVQIDEEIKKSEEDTALLPEYGIIPHTVSIPSINVEADVEPVGVLDNGQMGVPSDEDGVAWFEPGVLPGDAGNAVLAGHVDSYTGPAVFWDLNKLEPGDEIMVSDEGGETVTFRVIEKVSYERNDAPIEEIFGPLEKSRLNLITCSGTFNRSEGTHEERLVVYTELIEPEGDEQSVEVKTAPSSPTNVQVNSSRVTWHAVREEDVIGYRIYRSTDGKDFAHVGSVSAHERKSYPDPEANTFEYYVTAVNSSGSESQPSEIMSVE